MNGKFCFPKFDHSHRYNLNSIKFMKMSPLRNSNLIYVNNQILKNSFTICLEIRSSFL